MQPFEHGVDVARVRAEIEGLAQVDPPRDPLVGLDAVFDLWATVRHVDTVFERLHALVVKEEPVNA